MLLNLKMLDYWLSFLFVFQDAAEKEDKPSILKETIHNLALSEDTGSLWYIDNESSFLDAYSLLMMMKIPTVSDLRNFIKKCWKVPVFFAKRQLIDYLPWRKA